MNLMNTAKSETKRINKLNEIKYGNLPNYTVNGQGVWKVLECVRRTWIMKNLETGEVRHVEGSTLREISK